MQREKKESRKQKTNTTRSAEKKKLAERAKAEKRPTPSEPKSEPKKKRLSKAERLALEAKEDQEIAEAIEEMKRDMRYDVPSAKTDVLTELAGEAKKNGEQYGTYAAKVRGDGRLNIVNGHIVRPWEKGE